MNSMGLGTAVLRGDRAGSGWHALPLILVMNILVPLAGCGSSDDHQPAAVIPLGSCSAFGLTYVSQQELPLPELEQAGWTIVDGAAGKGEIGVLLEQRATGATAPPKLIRYDKSRKIRLNEMEVPLDDCSSLSVTYATIGWIGLAECVADGARVREAFSLHENGTTSPLFSFVNPRAVRIAFDEIDDQYWIWGFDGVFKAPRAAVAAFQPVALEPLAWGPTSGFDHVGNTLLFARDASEEGMSNLVAIQNDAPGERCQFNVEGVQALTGQSHVIVFGDGSSLWMLTRRGDLVEFNLHVTTSARTATWL